MSTCTDLINAINAVVVDPNLLASVDPSTIAVLNTGNTTETAFSLGAGGPAVLSLPTSSPSLNGVLFRLSFAGTCSSVSGNGSVGLYLGTSATLASNRTIFAADSNFATQPFAWSGTFLWDSATQTLTNMDWENIHLGFTPTNLSSVTSQASLKFVLSGKFGGSNAGNTITITEFKASLV